MHREDDSHRNKLAAYKPANHVNHFVNQFTLGVLMDAAVAELLGTVIGALASGVWA